MGQSRTEVKTINGRKWTVTQMPPTMSVPVIAKLGPIATGLVGPLLAGVKGGGDVNQLLVGLGSAIAAQLPPEEFQALALKLTEGDGLVFCGDARCNYDRDFIGDDLPDLFPVLMFVLEVNYAKFFGGLLARLTSAAAVNPPGTSGK